MEFAVKKKHIYLNLFLINFPVTAIASIIHRITGVILFFFFFVILYLLKLAVESESSFLMVSMLFEKFYIKLFLFFFLASFLYHFLFGLKHIIMDLGLVFNKSSSTKLTAILLVLFFIFSFIIFLSVVL